jgi:hypothetical protein
MYGASSFLGVSKKAKSTSAGAPVKKTRAKRPTASAVLVDADADDDDDNDEVVDDEDELTKEEEGLGDAVDPTLAQLEVLRPLGTSQFVSLNDKMELVLQKAKIEEGDEMADEEQPKELPDADKK